MRKQDFSLCKNKDADQLCSNCTADQCLCFRHSDTVQFLFYLNPEFQASSFLLSLYSAVCVRLGRKPRKLVFLRRGSSSLRLGHSEDFSQSHIMRIHVFRLQGFPRITACIVTGKGYKHKISKNH